MSFLLDTCIVSELRKRQDRVDPGVARWFAGTDTEDLYLSVLVIGEIRRGIESIRHRDPRAAESLDQWLDAIMLQHGERALSVDHEVASLWGHLSAPDPLPVVGGLLAATAMIRGLTLVTRNVKDVERTGVRLLNPFQTQ